MPPAGLTGVGSLWRGTAWPLAACLRLWQQTAVLGNPRPVNTAVQLVEWCWMSQREGQLNTGSLTAARAA